MSLEWKGDKVTERLEKASIKGINKTLGECVALAKDIHPFTNRTGTAERGIRIVRGAQYVGFGAIVGSWGSVLVSYFKYLEFGTKNFFMKSSLIPAGKAAMMKAAVQPPWRGGHFAPTLRPVAGMIYPKLAGYIREYWDRG